MPVRRIALACSALTCDWRESTSPSFATDTSFCSGLAYACTVLCVGESGLLCCSALLESVVATAVALSEMGGRVAVGLRLSAAVVDPTTAGDKIIIMLQEDTHR